MAVAKGVMSESRQVCGTRRSVRAAALLALSLVLAATARESAGAQLRSLQTGTVTLSGGLLAVTLPTAVDTTKAFVVFGVSENSNDPLDGHVSGRLAGPTALTFERVAAPARSRSSTTSPSSRAGSRSSAAALTSAQPPP